MRDSVGASGKSADLLTPGSVGMPIGNLTSQIFANIYLNELDQFVKRKLRVKHYVRYMNDFILLHESKEELVQILSEISQFMTEKLKLTLSPQKVRLDQTKNGITFVGYIVRRNEIRMRSVGIRRIRGKVMLALNQAIHHGVFGPLIDDLPTEDLTLIFKDGKVKRSSFYASYSSFCGFSKDTSYSETLKNEMAADILKALSKKKKN